MIFNILTLFPEMFEPLQASLLGKAQDKGAIEINVIDIREFSNNRHKKCDDYPFGGGAGMLMTPQPLYDAIMSVKTKDSLTLYMSPSGKTLNQEKVKSLAQVNTINLVCGHYEGIDQRVIDLCIDEELSIGDYVLTGGEIPAMVVVDAVSRYIPEVLHSDESVIEESFSSNLLEYPQYTRPQEFKGKKVPEVLLSGHHENIAKWRKEQAIKKTKKLRPDLLDN